MDFYSTYCSKVVFTLCSLVAVLPAAISAPQNIHTKLTYDSRNPGTQLTYDPKVSETQLTYKGDRWTQSPAPSLHTAPYVKQCSVADPKLVDCITGALHHLRPFLAQGIPEIEMPSVEPFRMDELSLSLTTGPNGYKVTLRDIDIYGASNFTITKLRLSDGSAPFESKIRIPELKINARYTSSGVLIILPASGNGTFHSTLSDILATVKGTVSETQRDGHGYLHVDTLSIDLNIKQVRMMVKKVFNNNRILMEATNLFLRENGHEVLKAMMPQLRLKLAEVFQKIANQLLKHVPTEMFLIPA